MPCANPPSLDPHLSNSNQNVAMSAPKTTKKTVPQKPSVNPGAPAPVTVTPTALLVGLTHVDPDAYQPDQYGRPWEGRNGCQGCDDDVAGMRSLLEREGYTVTTLLDGNATAGAVTGALAAAARAAASGSTFLFYYSGHGGQIMDRNQDETDGEDETLCLFDGELRDDVLNEAWISFPEGSAIYMLADCCHSGTNFRALGRQSRPVAVDFAKDLLGDAGMKAALLHLSGCRDDQESAGYESGGLFTNTLVSIWNKGRYAGTWDTLHDAISAELPPGQRPAGNLYGPAAAAEVLASLRPFQPVTPAANGQNRPGNRAISARGNPRSEAFDANAAGRGGVVFSTTGKMSTFGGPLDFGVSASEGLALFDRPDLRDPLHRGLFLPTQPPGTSGLARRLNPDRFYLACRWSYAQTPREFLRNCVATVTNPRTGQSAEARPADWGPHTDTGRATDLSPGLAAHLGLETDDICLVEISRGGGRAALRDVSTSRSPRSPDDGGREGHGTNNPPPSIDRSRRSPYYSSRNNGDINAIVLHYTTGSTTESTLSWFESNPRSVSAHYVIGRDGSIYQMVDDSHRANHCMGANRNTIGIEHVATAGQQLAAAQERSSITLIRWLVAQYNIPKAKIQGHMYADGYSGDTNCPHSLFGQRTEQAVIDWVSAHI
ncbi:MAG: hypothetical protein EOP86_15570 [Verrucomicrobiaceae bacterium]|nr:MAG: hypothetical protein EOP86_15570 [Verrucomicrobiaceae bacterium]